MSTRCQGFCLVCDSMDVACHRSPSLEHGPAVSSGPGLQEPRRLEDASPDPAHTAGLLRLLPVQRAASKTLDTHASRFHDGHFANDKGTRARVKPRRGGGGGAKRESRGQAAEGSIAASWRRRRPRSRLGRRRCGARRASDSRLRRAASLGVDRLRRGRRRSTWRGLLRQAWPRIGAGGLRRIAAAGHAAGAQGKDTSVTVSLAQVQAAQAWPVREEQPWVEACLRQVRGDKPVVAQATERPLEKPSARCSCGQQLEPQRRRAQRRTPMPANRSQFVPAPSNRKQRPDGKTPARQTGLCTGRPKTG